jgi:acetyltransferase
VTNARGPAVLAVDALRNSGGALADLAPDTVTELSRILTTRWDRQNPIDVGDDGDAVRFARAAGVAARDPNADALLVLLAPEATIDPVRAAAGLAEVARASAKPVLACWMWGAANPESLAILREADVPTLHSPEAAVRTFSYLWRHSENLRCLATLNAALGEAEQAVAPERAADVLAEARRSAHTVLPEAIARELFSAYGLPVWQRRDAWGKAEAVQAADAVGYPVLVELAAGPGGAEPGAEVCRLKAAEAAAVGRAMDALEFVAREHFGAEGAARVMVRPLVPPGTLEVAVSSTAHADMGPVIRLGEGGTPGGPPGRAVMALAPLTPLTAREMIQQCPLLASHAPQQGEAPPDLDALATFLLQFSRLAVEQPWVREVTVNPLLVGAGQVAAGDIRITLHDEEVSRPGCPASSW